jgi:hypothetical protein
VHDSWAGDAKANTGRSAKLSAWRSAGSVTGISRESNITLELEAETLFEAVAHAVHRFRSSNWDGHAPGPGCAFSVEVQPQAPVTYSIALNKVEEFARFGTVKGRAIFSGNNACGSC